MSYKIFYINLDKAVERNNFMNEQFSSKIKKSKVERFSAINKDSLTKDYIKSICNPRSYYYLELNNNKRAIHEDLNTTGQIACYLSHYTLWQKLLSDPDNEYYIIFEDDVIIDDNFETTVDNILKKKTKVDFLSLIYYFKRNNDTVYKQDSDFFVIQNPFYGMLSYMISKNCAKKLTQWSIPLLSQVDAFIGYVANYENDLNFFLYKNSLGRHSGLFDSQLSHGNCLHCNTEYAFNIKIKSGFGWFKNKVDDTDSKIITINLKIVLILLILIIAVCVCMKKVKTPQLQFSS